MSQDKTSATVPTKPIPVVYACSGCSNAGEIADRVARQLTREGAAKMSCLAGIGGRVKSLVATAERAERILVVDGCPLNCAAHTLRAAGFQRFDHLELHKLGVRKGSTPVTEKRIADGVAAAKRFLAPAVDAPPNRGEGLTAPLPAAIESATIADHEHATADPIQTV